MIRTHSLSGKPYIMVRKVDWDECWHACWRDTVNGIDVLNWDRYDKDTAWKIANEIAKDTSSDFSINIGHN